MDVPLQDGVFIMSGDNNFKVFNESLVGWDVVGADDQPLPCTEEVKKKIFDFGLAVAEVDGEKISMANFVIQKALAGIRREAEKTEKN